MNLAITIFNIICILFVLFYGWYKLRDAGEGDHAEIDLGSGWHVERWAYEERIGLVLALFIIMLLIGLLLP